VLPINLKFWKKKDEDLGLDNLDKGLPGMGDTPTPPDIGFENNQGFDQPNLGLENSPTGLEPKKNDFSGNPDFSQPTQNHPFSPDHNQQPSQGFQQPNNNSKDFDIVISRLDAIKSQLESMNQRLLRLEMMAEKSSHDEMPARTRRYAREY